MKMMRTCSIRGLAVALAVVSAMTWRVGEVSGAQESAPASSPARSALAMTRDRGVPTVLIVTSRGLPSSTAFSRGFLESEWARTHRGLVRVIEVVAEEDPHLVSALGVGEFPTAVVYRLGESGLLVRGQTSEHCSSVSGLAGWLGPLGSGLGPGQGPEPISAVGAKADPEVLRASHGGKSLPSPQGYAPPSVPTAPPFTPQFVPQYAPQPTTAMTPQVTTGSANVISVPAQNFVIQQQAPQIFMAPSQAPVVYVPQQLQQQHQQMMVMAAPSAAPAVGAAPNLFLPASQPSQPMMAVAPQPIMTQPAMAMAAQPTMAMASQPTMAMAAQPTQLAAVSSQQLSLPTTSSRNRVRVRGPGLFASSLAKFGERLTRLGRVRIVSEQETTLEAPLSQAGTPGLTTISTSSSVPLALPAPQLHQALLAAPTAPCPDESCKVPHPSLPRLPDFPGVQPTPQGTGSGHPHPHHP
jgi:hypothetical protein